MDVVVSSLLDKEELHIYFYFFACIYVKLSVWLRRNHENGPSVPPISEAR